MRRYLNRAGGIRIGWVRWSIVMIGAVLTPVLLIALLSPLLFLWMPEDLRRHSYHQISFNFMANRMRSGDGSRQEVVRGAIAFTRSQLWLFDNSRPYPGKPFDYLVKGIGWCDYSVKVFSELVAAKGVHVRYDFLKDQNHSSPHTIAEVFLDGAWRAVDPFYNVIFGKDSGEWARLEELTPEFVAQLPELVRVEDNPRVHENLMNAAQLTFPLRHPPDRSEDYVKDKNLMDVIAGAYVDLLPGFAYWYQDQYLAKEAAYPKDIVSRLWMEARHYHLYGRLGRAEVRYRRLLTDHRGSPFDEQATLFLSQLLVEQRRFEPAREVLQPYLMRRPKSPWANFYLAQCHEGLSEPFMAIEHFLRVREWKLYADALEQLWALTGAG